MLDAARVGIGFEVATAGTICGADDAVVPSVAIDSPPGDGRASLLAAQASVVASAKRSMGMDNLWEA
ncbi:MAG TPA: hypothetical protein VII30_10030 [Gemmatimonadaceae bacterium]